MRAPCNFLINVRKIQCNELIFVAETNLFICLQYVCCLIFLFMRRYTFKVCLKKNKNYIQRKYLVSFSNHIKIADAMFKIWYWLHYLACYIDENYHLTIAIVHGLCVRVRVHSKHFKKFNESICVRVKCIIIYAWTYETTK